MSWNEQPRRKGRFETKRKIAWLNNVVAGAKKRKLASDINKVEEKIDRFEAWKNALKTEKMTSYMKVCSRHFNKEDYILPDVVGKTRRLKTTAVPSCNLPSSATRKTPSVAEADEARLQKQIRRRMLKQMAQRMQVDRDTENESTDSLNSVKLPSNVTNCEINTEMIHCHQIKEEPTDSNEGQIETYNEEGICCGNIEYLEDDKSLVFAYVNKINETERYEKEGGSNETTEYCEDNKDFVFINVDNVEKTEGHTKESTDNQSIGHSKAKEDIIINNTCSANTCSAQEDIPGPRRSIVNISFMLREIHRTFNNHSRGIDCQFKYWNLVNRRRRGLLTEFFFKCDKCHYEASIQSEPEGTPNLNAISITAADAAGIRFSQLKQLLTAMDIV